jgi:thiol-disulfide isomerase/thioredoxin/tetratricopeptide (TPR) repeat protein
MYRHVASLALAALALAALPAAADAPAPVAAAPAAAAPLTGPQVGRPAPDFALTTLDGKSLTLASFRGKTLVVNVWATWCPPCREEMPTLIGSYGPLAKQNVAFLGVDTTEEAPIVRAYAVAKGLPYPQAVAGSKDFEKAYDVAYFPTTYVIDPQGILRARYIDVIAPAQLARFVAEAKAGRNGTIVSPLQERIDAELAAVPPVTGTDPATVSTQARAAAKAIEKAEDMLNDSDAAKGNPTDLLRTRVEEAAVRDQAIAALAKTATSPADKALLASLQGDAARDREQWQAAFDDYSAVLAIDPKSEDALDGLAFAAARLDRYADAVDADQRLAALEPKSVDAQVSLGLALAKAGRYPDAYAAFERATTLGQEQVAAKPGNAGAVRKLAWAYLYEGRTYAKGGDPVRARAAFESLLAWTAKLPANDIRHDMYLEEGQEAIVALALTEPGKTALSLAPWTGPELPGSIPNTMKYRLVVAGAAGSNVQLHALDVPKGWVASFCSDKVCSPFKVAVLVPAAGVKVLEFQLVPPDDKAKAARVRVTATDGTHSATATT